MRILMLCYEFPPVGGGGARVVYGLSKELVRLGHKVDLITMGFRGLPGHERVHGVEVYRVPCLRAHQFVCTELEALSYVTSALPIVRRLVTQHDYDLSHAHFILPDGLLAWHIKKYARLPYVITAHGSDVPGYNPHQLQTAHALLAPLWKSIVRHAAYIITPSQTLSSLVLRQSDDAKVANIANGIDLDRFDPNMTKQKQILIVTRMLERKGAQYVLKALQELPVDHQVHLVGDGPYLPQLQQLAQSARMKVVFWGWMDNRSPELKELYETSTIFALPSEAENFPIALLEAMAAGLAIITTSATGCAEVVGDTGILVKAKDIEEIKQALRKLTTDPALCRELGQAARKRVSGNFSWTAIARKYISIYDNCGTVYDRPIALTDRADGRFTLRQ